MGYFEAYANTLAKVSESLTQLAKQFTEEGYNVMTNRPRGKFIRGLFVEKDGKHLSIWFVEVPYAWQVTASIKPNTTTGSGYEVKKFAFEKGLAPSIDDLKECFRDNYKGQDLNPSYMVKYELKND